MFCAEKCKRCPRSFRQTVEYACLLSLWIFITMPHIRTRLFVVEIMIMRFFYGCVRFSLKHLQCENISQTVFAACCWSWCGSHSQIKMMRNLDTGSKGIKILTSDYVNINGSASRSVVRLSTWSINNTNSWMANENEIDLFLDAVISNQTRKITKTPGSIKFFFRTMAV